MRRLTQKVVFVAKSAKMTKVTGVKCRHKQTSLLAQSAEFAGFSEAVHD